VAESVIHDGVRLAFAAAGTGAPGMVFIHGWACDRSYFAPQFDHFAGGHAVVSVDLRGHGDSDKPEPDRGGYDIDTLAADVLAVTGSTGMVRPVLVGHSLGALVALACAVRDPATGALVMVDPAPITNEPAKVFFRQSVDAVRADRDRSWRTAFVNGMFLPTDVARRAAITADMPAMSPATAAALLRAMVDFDSVGALGEVRVPVLSIGSAVPTNRSDDLARICPAITIGQTVGAGHFNHLEVPDQVNAMIERFMAVNDR
jgi:pimeloyl-ACP methyl ester carboxylesterase